MAADIFDKLAALGPTLKKAAVPTILGGSALAAGSFVGLESFKKNPEENASDKAGKAVGMGISTALYGTVAVLGANAIAGGPIKQGIANAKAGTIHAPKIFDNKTPLTKEVVKKFASKPLVMGGAGAAIGGIIGYNVDKDDPNTGAVAGAAIGGVGGAVASTAIKGVNLWKNIGPVGRTGVVIGGTIALAVGGRAIMKQPEYQSSDMSESDGAGGYTTSPSQGSGVKERLTKMSATGDVVLGLNRKR